MFTFIKSKNVKFPPSKHIQLDKHELTDELEIFWFREKSNKAVGAVYVYLDDKQSAYISNLSVFEDARNKGLGTEMLNYLIKFCQYNKYKQVFLRVINDSWMHEWYKRNGFYDWYDDNEYSEFIWMKRII